MIKKISMGIGFIIAVCTLLTIFHALDSYVAKADDIKSLNQAILVVANDLKDTKDLIRYKSVQERVWQLEGFYDKKPMPDPVKKQYLELQNELKEIDMRMKKK